MNNGHAKTAGWLAAAAGLALAGAAWAQQAAPVNPEFLQWEREQAEKKAQPHRRGEGDEEEAFGLIPTMFDMGYLTDLNENVVQGVGEEYPERYDMREEGLLTPIKSQGGYGTCWAFAAMGAMESWIKKSEGVTLDLSENHLANLHGWDFDFSVQHASLDTFLRLLEDEPASERG